MTLDLHTELPATITPLIARHAEEAAFYWSLLDQSVGAPRLSLARYRHFNALLDAHLEGLDIAGAEGLPPAIEALARWRKAGEAFVCTWLAFRSGDEAAVQAVAAPLIEQPDALLRGAISALAWLPPDDARRAIAQWSAADAAAPLQVAALRARALIGPADALGLPQALNAYLQADVAPVRAAAARALAACLGAQAAPDLARGLNDADPCVRAESAIGLAAARAPEAAPVLWTCVAEQARVHDQATGWFRMQAARRLTRWVRHLATLVPTGHADLPALFAHLPPRIGLVFALYHGDPAFLPFVREAMKQPGTARHAGWVWQTLTGIELETHRLVLPDPDDADDDGPITEARLDADNGLPLPDAEAIDRYPFIARAGTRLLLGKEISPAHALDLLELQPQALRAVAAHALRAQWPQSAINVRAPAGRQRAQMQRLREGVPT